MKWLSSHAPPLATTGTGNAFAYPAGDLQIIARLHAIGIDAVEHDLARATRHRLLRPRPCVPSSLIPAAAREDRPASRGRFLGINGNDHALATERFRTFLDNLGSRQAAEFRLILSAPARSNARMSLVERTPPPTVSGMKQRSAVLSITSRIDFRPSEEAVISKKTNSSAPCSL